MKLRTKTETWDSRKEAADFYLRAIAGSEGSECERYTKSTRNCLLARRSARMNTKVKEQILAIRATPKAHGREKRLN